MSDAHNNTILEVQCVGDSENRLINTTLDENPIIHNTLWSDNTRDGISLLNCIVSLRTEQLSRYESSLFVSCLNSELELQTNKTLQIQGKRVYAYMYIHSCP